MNTVSIYKSSWSEKWCLEVITNDIHWPIREYLNQKDAKTIGKIKARRSKCEMTVFGERGEIVEKNSYGHYPKAIKG